MRLILSAKLYVLLIPAFRLFSVYIFELCGSDVVETFDLATYTLSSVSASGFSSSSPIASQSISTPIQCDIDFSFSVRITGVEENGKDSLFSASMSVAVAVSAVADFATLSLSV
eukprot:Rmarinus@m.11373